MLLEVDENLEKRQNLWRYMDLAKFVYLANTGTLWLARADTFRDAQEGRFPSEMRRFIEKAYEKFGDKDNSPVRDADDFQDFLLKIPSLVAGIKISAKIWSCGKYMEGIQIQ